MTIGIGGEMGWYLAPKLAVTLSSDLGTGGPLGVETRAH